MQFMFTVFTLRTNLLVHYGKALVHLVLTHLMSFFDLLHF